MLKTMFIIRIKVVKGTYILDGSKTQRFWQTKFTTAKNLHSRLHIQLKSQISQGFVEIIVKFEMLLLNSWLIVRILLCKQMFSGKGEGGNTMVNIGQWK